MKYKLIIVCSLVFFLSCSTKKDVLLFQDKSKLNTPISFQSPKIQANDILSIQVSTLQPELALPYNSIIQNPNTANIQIETLKLQGYLVSLEGTINFPVLGTLHVAGKTSQELEAFLNTTLEQGNHLVSPTINVRVINGKVTILGEVARPGTYGFTEQNISVLQALGLAGDLTIRGKRKEVLLIREEAGQRSYTTLDLTQTNWFDTPYYYVRPNDVLVINPNTARVKNAGFVSEPATLLSMASILLSMIILLTR
ncbi:MAG: polysaccharide biosynthesis/export family protein [Flavobacterium psychrophilum]